MAYAKENGRKIVAILDTGVNSDYCSYEVNFTSEGDSDDNGHGTLMAKNVLAYSDGCSFCR